MENNEDQPEPEQEEIEQPQSDSEPDIQEPEEPSDSETSEENEEPAEDQPEPEVSETKEDTNTKPSRFHKLKSILSKKKVWIPTLVVLILLILGGVPYTRYELIGLVWKQDYSVKLTDSQTLQPVSDATVVLDGKTAVTNNQGKVTLKVKVGNATLIIKKDYYSNLDQKILVGLKSKTHNYNLKATGRQVPITVVNKIDGASVANVLLSAGGTKARTNNKGKVTMVLPANKTTLSATIGGSGYNTLTTNIEVTGSVVASNTFELVPAGKVYYLSNATGKINVMSTNLDGSDQQTVLPGTGNEDPSNTSLIASSDGKYLALLAQRSGSQPSIYIIDTADNNQMTTVDSGNVDFSLVGWDGHNLIYMLRRLSVQNWQPDQYALKSYNADSEQLDQLDQTNASGSSDSDATWENYDTVNILANGTILYSKGWYSESLISNSVQGHIYSVNPDGTDKNTLQATSVPSGTQTSEVNIDGVQYGPASEYFYDGFSTYYNYTNGGLTTDSSLTSNSFDQFNDSGFYVSSSSNQAAWTTVRNGQTIVFVGDGNSSNQVATLGSNWGVNAWVDNNYLIVNKDDNQLYIIAANGTSTQKPYELSSYFSNTSEYNYQ